SSAGTGGKVVLVGQGGVQVAGNIQANGTMGGGTVEVNGSEPKVAGVVRVFNGIVYGTGSLVASDPKAGAGALLSVQGNIDTSANTASGGSVKLVSDANIFVQGNLNTNVITGGTVAGNITMTSLQGAIRVGGNLNASGADITNAISSQNATSGGIVELTAPAF